MNRKSLRRYIHNLKQLRRAMLRIGLDEVVRAIDQNLAAAYQYRDFLAKNRLLEWLGVLMSGNPPGPSDDLNHCLARTNQHTFEYNGIFFYFEVCGLAAICGIISMNGGI